jgi:hypothetical protein
VSGEPVVNIVSCQLFERRFQDISVEMVGRGVQRTLAQAYSWTFARVTGSYKAQLSKYLATLGRLCNWPGFKNAAHADDAFAAGTPVCVEAEIISCHFLLSTSNVVMMFSIGADPQLCMMLCLP